MSEILKETLNNEGAPILIYKNFKYIKSRCNIGGEIYWKCVHKKCRAYMATEGQPGKRFIVDSDLNHNHESADEKVKPSEATTTMKRKHEEVETVIPRKSLAARTETICCSSSAQKEKRGIFKSWSFAQRKIPETSDSSFITSSDDGSRVDEIGGVPPNEPPFPCYLKCTEFNTRSRQPAHSESDEADKRDTKHGQDSSDGMKSMRGKFRDEYDVAGWMYGNQLRSLDPQQRFVTEKLVADIIFKARLKLLKVTSRVE